MSGRDRVLGSVHDMRLEVLSPEDCAGELLRLTRVRMVEAVAPEAREVALTDYTDRVIMVSGDRGGGWIYAAEIIDVAGPILTAMVQRAFSA